MRSLIGWKTTSVWSSSFSVKSNIFCFSPSHLLSCWAVLWSELWGREAPILGRESWEVLPQPSHHPQNQGKSFMPLSFLHVKAVPRRLGRLFDGHAACQAFVDSILCHTTSRAILPYFGKRKQVTKVTFLVLRAKCVCHFHSRQWNIMMSYIIYITYLLQDESLCVRFGLEEEHTG